MFKNGKWNLTLLVWALLILGLPALLCAAYRQTTGLQRDGLNTVVSLYLAMLGIMVTVFLTWYVYRTEQRREEKTTQREEEDARRMIAAVLRDGVAQAVHHSAGFHKIADVLIQMMAPAIRSLSIEQAQLLSDCMRSLQGIGDAELDDWDEANTQAWQFALRFLPEPAELFEDRLMETQNWEWLISDDLRELFAALGAPLEAAPAICTDKDGQRVYQQVAPHRYRVWASDGRLLLDGRAEGLEVMEGYAELQEEGVAYLYRGHYLNGFRHGYGVQYFARDSMGPIAKEGFWQRDKLFHGIIYQVALEDDVEPDEDEDEAFPYNPSPYGWINQFRNPAHAQSEASYMPPFRVCNVRMVQGEVQVIQESIQTVEEFSEHWQPRTEPLPPSTFSDSAE